MSKLSRKSDLESTYTKGPARKDLFFGDFFVYNAIKGGSQIICVEKLFNEEESVKREIDAKKKRILNKHEYLVNLLDYSLEEQRNWCSTFYLLKCFYEYVDRNLIGEILDRKKMAGDKNQFKMEELTHLMYQQVYANAFLQERGIAHGDISPNTIFVSPKNEFKLAFRMNEMMTPERVQVDKAIKNEPLYLAPAFYEAVKQRTLDKLKHNQHKSDMFALGLTVLQAGLMKGVQDIYVGDRFDARKLEELLLEFETKYEDNPLLYTSVRKMCEINEDERPDFISLKSALPEYDVIKDYFQKVEAGIYEEEQIDEQGTTDSMKDGLNYHYEADQYGQPIQGHDFNAFDDSHGYQNQQYLQGQGFGGQGVGPAAMNFNKSISNKLSSSSNQNSQNNSFNKQAGFGGEADLGYNQQAQFNQQKAGNQWNQQQNTTNLKQTNHVVQATNPYQQNDFAQSQPNIPQQEPLPAQQFKQQVPQQPPAQQWQQPPQPQQQYQVPPQPNYQQNQYAAPAPVPAPMPVQQQQPKSQPVNFPNEVPKDDFFAVDFYDFQPEKSTNSGFNSYSYSTATNENSAFYQPSTPSQSVPRYTPSAPQNPAPAAPTKQFTDMNIHYQEVDGYYFPESDEPAQSKPTSQPQIQTTFNDSNNVYNQAPQYAQSSFPTYAQQPVQKQVYQAPPVQTYQPAPTYQPQSQPNNVTAFSPYSNQQSAPTSGFTGNTKIFDGKLYNEMREESNVLENGVMIKKTILKYVQADYQAPVQRPATPNQQQNSYFTSNYTQAKPTVVQYR